MYLQIMLDLMAFAIYLSLNTIFINLQWCYWKLTGVAANPDNWPVRLMKIKYRRKRDAEEISRVEDFVAIHEKFEALALLDDSHWVLYALNKTDAVFVRLPKSINEYQIKASPFIYLTLFEQAVQLALVPLQKFISWTDNLAKGPQPRTVIFTNTARCGSTVLGQMLQHSNKSVVYGECYPLTILAIGLWLHYWQESQMTSLLRAVITALRKNVNPNQLCILKTASTEARLVPFIARACPDVKHLFMFRKNALNSVERMISRDGTLAILMQLYDTCPVLVAALSWLAVGDSRWQRLIKPVHVKERAAIVYVSPYGDYLNNEHLFCQSVIWFKDVINSPEQTLKPIFAEIGLPEDCIKDAVCCLDSDSQKGTFLSQTAMNKVEATMMTDELKEKLKIVAETIGVPTKVFFD